MLDRIEIRVALAKKDTSLAAVCRAEDVPYLKAVRCLGGYGPALGVDEERRLRAALELPLETLLQQADASTE